MLIIGHRGAKGLATENTLDSIKAAIDCDVDLIEIDVRTTADGIVVLSHDPFILTRGQKIFIAETKYPDLKSVKNNLATLEEALDLIGNKTGVIIEVKEGAKISPITRIIGKSHNKHLLVSSFDFKILKQIHKKYPKIELIVNEKWSGVRAGRRARKLDTKTLVMNQKWLWSGFIRSVDNSGYKLYAYTLNNPNKAKKWQKYGLKGVITDFPNKY